MCLYLHTRKATKRRSKHLPTPSTYLIVLFFLSFFFLFSSLSL